MASLSIVLSLFIHKVSSKHDRASKLNLSLNASHIHYMHLFLRRFQVQVLDTFRYTANEFYLKMFVTVYSTLLM